MILSHQHKFIFLKNIKVAGTSLEIALSKYCGSEDIISPINENDEDIKKIMGLKGAQNHEEIFRVRNFIPKQYLPKSLEVSLRKGSKYYNHIPASKLKNMISNEIWDSYFKFAIVRNPYDRIISHYYWGNRFNENPPEFRTWMMKPSTIKRIKRNSSIHVLAGNLACDFFVRFENIEEDLQYVSSKIGLDENIYDVMKTVKSKAGVRKSKSSVEEMFDGFDEGKRLVEEYSAIDFEVGGYKFI